MNDSVSIALLKGHAGRINGAMVVSGQRLLSWSNDGTLRIWNAEDGIPIAVLKGHSDAVIGALEISAERLLSWSQDGSLRLWDSSGVPLSVWAQPHGSISTVVEMTRQRFAVSAGSHVMFVDIADGGD